MFLGGIENKCGMKWVTYNIKNAIWTSGQAFSVSGSNYYQCRVFHNALFLRRCSFPRLIYFICIYINKSISTKNSILSARCNHKANENAPTEVPAAKQIENNKNEVLENGIKILKKEIESMKNNHSVVSQIVQEPGVVHVQASYDKILQVFLGSHICLLYALLCSISGIRVNLGHKIDFQCHFCN